MIARKGRLGKVFDPLLMLPLATSAVTLGFGFVIALDEPPLNLRSSWLIIPISHTLVAFPFVVRSVLPSLRAIPQSLREAAQVLGADSGMLLRTIDLPLISRGIAVGATFAFTVSMGEFGASLFVAQREAGNHTCCDLSTDWRSRHGIVSTVSGDERHIAIGMRHMFYCH